MDIFDDDFLDADDIPESDNIPLADALPDAEFPDDGDVDFAIAPLREITPREYTRDNWDRPVDKNVPWEERINGYQWGALCIELALLNKGFGVGSSDIGDADPVAFILAAYKGFPSDLPSMMANEKFMAQYREAIEYVEDTGKDAGFILRNRSVAEMALGYMASLISERRVDAKGALAIYEATSANGRLKPPKDEGIGGSGVTLSFTMTPAVKAQIAFEDLPRQSIQGLNTLDIIEHETDEDETD